MIETAAAEVLAKKAHIWPRPDDDWYVEPPSATRALLRREQFVGPILDPCCGQGNIVRTMREAGYDAVGADIVDRSGSADWFWGTADFLADGQLPLWFSNIVMNPPFFRAKGAEAFIRKALAVARGKVAVFVDVRFLAGESRAEGLFAEHPPSRIWIVYPRVSCPPGEYLAAGGRPQNGSSDWCWLVWDLTSPRMTMPPVGWARRPEQ